MAENLLMCHIFNRTIVPDSVSPATLTLPNTSIKCAMYQRKTTDLKFR